MNAEKLLYRKNWKNFFNQRYDQLEKENPGGGLNEMNSTHLALGDFKLFCFTQRLLKQYATPWRHLSELEARQLYLMNKHHWPLSYVLELNQDADYLFALHEELQELKLNPVEYEPIEAWLDDFRTPPEFEDHFDRP